MGQIMEIAWRLTDTSQQGDLQQRTQADRHIAAERWAAKQWAERLADLRPVKRRDDKQAACCADLTDS